jgi:hypothetical protein
MPEGIIAKDVLTIHQPPKVQPAKLRQFRELSLKVDLAAKIKLNILTTMNAVEVQEGLRNGTVIPDYKKQILTAEGKQVGTFTISEARIKEVAA